VVTILLRFNQLFKYYVVLTMNLKGKSVCVMAKGGSPVTDLEGVEPAPDPFGRPTDAIAHGTPDM